METVSVNGQAWMDIVLQFFQHEQWSFQVIDNKPVIRAGFRGEHGTWVCYIYIEQELHRLLFHSLMGLNINPQHRFPVLEYLERVNHMLESGRFEMDMDSGDVRFKTALDIPDGKLTLPIIRSLAYTNVHTMDHYFSGVVAVVHGGLSPEAALARVDLSPVSGLD